MNSSKICENYLIKKFFARPFCLTDHNLTETAKTFLTNLLRKTSCRNERYFSYICRSTEICFSYSIQLKTKMLQRAVKTTKKLPIHFLRNIYLLVPSIFNRHRKKAKVIKKPEKKSMSELFQWRNLLKQVKPEKNIQFRRPFWFSTVENWEQEKTLRSGKK